jgi:hypothetical protein
MDSSIEQFAQDLARASYAARPCAGHLVVAKWIADFLRKSIAEATRDDMGRFVDSL